MQRNPFHTTVGPRHARGFTLIELLVVIAIIAVLSAAGFLGASRFIDNGRKVQAVSLFRDMENGLQMYVGDYNHPPLPEERRASGEDTVFSEPNKGGEFSNGLLVAVLAGDAEVQYKGKFDASELNPKNEVYVQLKFNADNKSGVGKNGAYFDPWGREIMVAVNAYKSTNSTDALMDENPGSPGTNDNHLETYKYGQYKETAPRDQAFAFWSYGNDGKKGAGAKNPREVVGFTKTDDVISW